MTLGNSDSNELGAEAAGGYVSKDVTHGSKPTAEDNMSTIRSAAKGDIELQKLLIDTIRTYQGQNVPAEEALCTQEASKKDHVETFDGWTVSATDLTNLTAAILRKAGCNAEEAQIVAENLVESNLKGHDSHGVLTMMGYLPSIPTGKLKLNSHADVISDRGAFVHIDGHLGFGQIIGQEAMEKGIAKCKEHGVAIVGVKNSHHLARIGKWAEMACEAGFVCVHLTNVTGHPPIVAPFLGRDARLGTNPFTIGFPGPSPDSPVILDCATSEMAAGKVREFWFAGKPLREGVLLDKNGDPTTDPKSLGDNGCLLPFGSIHTAHKGYGLAMMCELVGGVLTGGNLIEPSYPCDKNIVNSMTVILIDPAMFGIPLSQLREETSRLVDYVKSSPTGSDGVSVEVPGEMERKYFETRSANGIPFAQGSYDVMVHMAEGVGISADEAKKILGGTQAKLYEDRNTRISVV